jgi:hypothetical protein
VEPRHQPRPRDGRPGRRRRLGGTVPVIGSATTLDIVFNDGLGNWDNNNGQDWHFAVEGATPAAGFTVDGTLDASSTARRFQQRREPLGRARGLTLYLATNPASGGLDRFSSSRALPA